MTDSWRERLRRVVPAIVSVMVFVAALEVLRTELDSQSLDRLKSDIRLIPSWRITAAFLLTFVNYLALTTYDLLAFAYIGRRLSRWRVVRTAFLAYAVAHSTGFALVSGLSVRYRFYRRWGVSVEELS